MSFVVDGIHPKNSPKNDANLLQVFLSFFFFNSTEDVWAGTNMRMPQTLQGKCLDWHESNMVHNLGQDPADFVV